MILNKKIWKKKGNVKEINKILNLPTLYDNIIDICK